MKSTSNSIWIPVSPAPFAIILPLFGLACIGMAGVLIAGMIGMPSEIADLWFIALGLLGLGILVTNHALWQWWGGVRITFYKEHFTVRNERTLFHREVKIAYGDYRRLYVTDEEFSFSTFYVWGLTQGRIIIHFKNGTKSIGVGLDEKEGRAWARKIDFYIRKHQTS